MIVVAVAVVVVVVRTTGARFRTPAAARIVVEGGGPAILRGPDSLRERSRKQQMRPGQERRTGKHVRAVDELERVPVVQPTSACCGV